MSKKKNKKPSIADTIIHNLDTKLTAMQLHNSGELDRAEEQTNYVRAYGDRCGRCGAPTFGMFPGSQPFCTDCVSLFKKLDHQENGEFMYFAEMIAEIRERNDGR